MKQTKSGYIPPSAPEIENVILGALLLEPGAYAEIEGFLSDEDFYVPKNATIFHAIESLHKAHEAIDMLTVREKLKATGKLAESGGDPYIAELTGNIAQAANIVHHAKIVKQKSVERQIILLSHQATKKIYDLEDIDGIMTWQRREIERLQECMSGNTATRHISVSVKKAITEMYLRREHNAQGKSTGITTGLSNLDGITGGWKKSDLIIIAARPAMGKTAFALHLAKCAAASGHPAAMFSLEMSDVSLADRLLLSESSVNACAYRTGKLSAADTVEIEKAAGILHDLPIHIDDSESATMPYIRSVARRLNRQGQCEIVIIDYLQLAEGEKGKNTYREQEVSRMSREAKRMAKELNIPVILLSQLNRESEKRTDKRPGLSDLRESGAIEQDADMVCLLHRPEYYNRSLDINGVEVHNGIEFIIAKYRNGATGSVILQHDGTLNRIFDYIRGFPAREHINPDRFHESCASDSMPF
ncbi:MAG: replicative DNA helicase [Tannerella sp.]|jgi:replicative DNA helicase|nr:replicative DNA helicase [Tannerella sp.]